MGERRDSESGKERGEKVCVREIEGESEREGKQRERRV